VEECGPCPVFASFYPGICLTTEEKARKNHSQGKRNFSQVNKNLSLSYKMLFKNLMLVDACIIIKFIQKNPTKCNSLSKFIIPCLYEV
jgi:hypothetical protein